MDESADTIETPRYRVGSHLIRYGFVALGAAVAIVAFTRSYPYTLDRPWLAWVTIPPLMISVVAGFVMVAASVESSGRRTVTALRRFVDPWVIGTLVAVWVLEIAFWHD